MLVVPGALPLHVIVVTMFSTPLASSESLCVVFIVTVGTSPPPVSKTLVVLSVGPTVGPGASDAQAQREDRTTQREASMPSQKACSDAEVLPECHERIAPNGTSARRRPPRADATKPSCRAIVWLHSLGIRAIRPQLGLAIPRIGHPTRWTILRDGSWNWSSRAADRVRA